MVASCRRRCSGGPAVGPVAEHGSAASRFGRSDINTWAYVDPATRGTPRHHGAGSHRPESPHFFDQARLLRRDGSSRPGSTGRTWRPIRSGPTGRVTLGRRPPVLRIRITVGLTKIDPASTLKVDSLWAKFFAQNSAELNPQPEEPSCSRSPRNPAGREVQFQAHVRRRLAEADRRPEPEERQ